MKKSLFYGIMACFISSVALAESYDNTLTQCKELMENNPPKVEVVYSFGSLRLDNSKSPDEIKEVFKQVYPNQETHKINGLTVLSPFARVENSIISQSKGDHVCYYPQRIQISAGYRPIVYISKDLTGNPCRFSLTVRHEQTHLDIGHLSLQNFASRLKSEFPNIVKEIGPVLKSKADKVSAADAVAKEMNEAYHMRLKFLFDDFVQKLLEENARIDTDENYEYEQQLCPDI